ncbi:MAG: hypothetical protein KAS32_18400, partial [Candidatus Peribacteraceae bacterium]|nr:hypothetical protein [Candidatus Peribacteraceae bacterium]
KAAAIVHVRNQTALTGLQAEIEAENEARPEFVKLVNKALSLFKNEDTRDLFFTGPDFTAENLLDMIIKFPEFEDTNEFYALPTPYAEFLYQGKLSRQNDAQDLQNEVEQTGGVV